MFKLEFISAKGDLLNLTNSRNFKITNVDGITNASSDISSSTVAQMDGDIINNVRVTPRGIVIDLTIERDVEQTKREILKIVKVKQKGTLRLTQDNRETQIVGIVEAIEMPRFSELVVMQISIYCSQPFWEDVDYIIGQIADYINLHYYPLDQGGLAFYESIPLGEINYNNNKIFINEGDVSVGMTITVVAIKEVVNPRVSRSGDEYIGVNIAMTSGDELIIKTGKGEKSITLNGRNVIDKIDPMSTWLQLETGENEFYISAESGTDNAYFVISYKQRYI